MKLPIKLTCAIILCIIILILPAYCIVIDLNENKSSITYSLSKFGIPFKIKALPTYGQIFLEESSNQSGKQLKTYFLKAFYIKSLFTSRLQLFRKLVEYEKYPFIFFTTDLKNPILLEDSKEINIEGYITFKGISKKVNILVKCKTKDNYISLEANVNIKMTDFDIKPPRILFITVDDLIKTKIELCT